MNAKHVTLDNDQCAVYLHVFTRPGFVPSSDEIMDQIAEAMEEVGLIVPDRVKAAEVEKIIGYAPHSPSATFRLPLKKRVLLPACLREVSRQKYVDVDLLRAVVGIWLHGAQLRRDTMCIPFSVFKKIERHEGEVIKLWPSVRQS